MMKLKKTILSGAVTAGMILCLTGCGTEQIAEKATGYTKQLKEATEDQNYSEYKRVYDYFKEAVKENIETPSTADFQVFSTSLVSEIKKESGYTFYNVQAYVDAETLLGSVARTYCDVSIAVSDDGSQYKYKINSME